MKLILVATLSLLSYVLAGPSEDMKKARAFYTEGKYQNALTLYGSVVETRSEEARKFRQEALASLAETQIRLGLNVKALLSADEYDLYYENGQYSDAIRYVRARIALYEGAVSEGIETLFQILTSTRDQALYQQVKNQVIEVLRTGTLSLEEMTRLVAEKQFDKQLFTELVLNLTDALKNEGRYKAARFYLNQILRDLPGTESAQTAQKRLDFLADKGIGRGVVLVIAPLNGPFADFGAEVAKGVALAFEQDANKPFSYQMVDSRGEPAYAVHRLQKLMEVENTVAIIGPVMSANAAAMGAWLSVAYPHVPLITPTATDRDIASLGANTFQLNIPNYKMAEDMGRHAALCEKLKKSLILAPRTDYGRTMAEGFSDAFERFGGEIQGVAFYTEGETDYNQVFRSLRQKKLLEYKKKLAVRFKTEDLSKVMAGRDEEKFLADSTVTFESIFLAASDPNDAALLAKQLHFYKINGRLLGSSGWYGRDLLRQGGRDIADAVFTASFFERSDEKSWVDFAQAFRKRWNEYPGIDRVSGLSYDAARLLLKAAEGQGDLLPALGTIQSFEGVYGTILLNERGENTNTQLVKVENFKFVKQKSCTE